MRIKWSRLEDMGLGKIGNLNRWKKRRLFHTKRTVLEKDCWEKRRTSRYTLGEKSGCRQIMEDLTVIVQEFFGFLRPPDPSFSVPVAVPEFHERGAQRTSFVHPRHCSRMRSTSVTCLHGLPIAHHLRPPCLMTALNSSFNHPVIVVFFSQKDELVD